MVRWFLNGRTWANDATAIVAVLLAMSLAGCSGEKEADKAKQAAAAPVPTVVVTETIQKTVPIYSEYVAQTDARETVEIRARVQAFLDAQHYVEGSVVKKDQLLFTLDKREYEAKLQQANAELEIAMARLGKAETDERRLKPLAERRAVPQQDYDNAAANLLSAKAAVSSAKSKVVEAELNLSYCTIKSPIAGLIGKRLVAPGNLVGKGDATLLTTVSSIDPIRANFTVSEAEYLRISAVRKDRGNTPLPLELILADGSVYPQKGRTVIFDRAMDTKTGTFAVVAEFPNPAGLLRPGLFGRVRGAAEVVENAILIPKRAVVEIQGTKSVLVVNADNTVALRSIRPGETAGELLIVQSGLQPGERVIVEGVQKARPGSKVNPTVASVDSQSNIKADAPAKEQSPVSEAAAKPGAK